MIQEQINVTEQVKAQTQILAQLEDFENKGVMTKKQYILKLKDVTRPLVLADYYPDVKLNDLCSFIGDLLGKYNVSYSRTKLPELFDEDEKRAYHQIDGNVTSGDNVTSPPLESREDQGIIGQLDFLEKQIGKSFDVMQQDDAADKLQTLENITAKSVAHIKSFDKNYKTASFFVDSFEKTFGSIEQADDTLQTLPKKQKDRMSELISKYHANVLLISEMQSEIVNIKDIKEIQAVQAMVSRDIDQRNKLSNWEKIMIWIAMKYGNIAKNQCAKLTGIDKKHITNNIYPTESPTETHTKNKHHGYISIFKSLLFECPDCGKQNTTDISRVFDQQVERQKLDLPFTPIVLKTADVS